MAQPLGTVVACVDFGSTFTKAALVDTSSGDLLATASHRTTVDTDVLDGWAACRAELAQADPRAAEADVLACSSAGGGLRIAVVGNEELVTAEAGRRVALSSGGRVVHVDAGGLTARSYDELVAGAPDVVLLVGGTDGGNAEVLEANARLLARSGWTGPVVVAGNVESQRTIAAVFEASGTPYVLADNVLPQIGVLAPDSARAAVREMFLRHVIGGKHLSRRRERGRRFTDLVRGATPDVVLTAVDLLARGLDQPGHPGVGDVVVVDVGGATTDVHSVVEVEAERQAGSGLSRDVVASLPLSRTVEGDLGMRWSAETTVVEGVSAGVLDAADEARLAAAAKVRRHDPAFLPADEEGRRDDELLATAAVAVAVRRHAGRQRVTFEGQERVVARTGKDLREVGLLVGSGGTLRSSDPAVAERVLGSAAGADLSGGWQLPAAPRVVVDRDYVLAPAGLLAPTHPVAAHRLLSRLREGTVSARDH